MRELSSSALYGARFRENAARALLLPRAYPGKRTPLWQQRLKAQSLLEVAKGYGQFPIVLETYRECLRDVLDLPGLEELLRGLHTRELSLVEAETQRASPFASSLLFDYVATYMYEGDTPNAERRAAALSLDRDLLRELLGQEELRELIDARRAGGGGGRPPAPERAHAGRQLRRPARRAARGGRPHRRGGPAALPARRVGAAGCSTTSSASGARCRCASEARTASSPQRTRGCTATPSARSRPAGCPPRSSTSRRTRSGASCAATRAPTGRSPRARWRSATGWTSAPPCASWSARATWFAASCGRAAPSANGATPMCCAACGALRWPRCARRSSPPSSGRWRASCPAWQGVDTAPPGGAGVDRLREILVPLQGLALSPEVWERDVLPRRVGAYSPAWMDQLCAGGELVWVGAGSLGRSSGKVALYFRDDARWLGPPPFKGDPPGRADPRRDPRAARARRVVLDRPAGGHHGGGRRRGGSGGDPRGPVGPGLDGRGDQRCLRPAARPAAVPGARAARRRKALRPQAPPRRAAGAGTVVAHRAAVRRRAGARPQGARAERGAARALRDRHPGDRAGRGDSGRLRRPLLGAGQPGDAGHRPARLLRRGTGRRAVRAARGDRAAARPALG